MKFVQICLDSLWICDIDFQKKVRYCVCTETKEHVLRTDRILNSLSEDDRQWLDDQLMAKMDIPEQERLRYYKAGLADAIELIHYLRT